MSSDSERSTDSSQGDDSTALRDATSQSSSTSLGTQTPDGKSRDAATHANVTPASEHDSSASSPVETLEADHLNASQTASEQKKGDAHNDEEDTESLSDVSEMSFGTVVTSQDWADGQGHAYFCEECGEEHWYDEEEEDEGSSDGSDGIHSLFEEDYIRKADLDSIRPMPSTGIQFLDLPDDILISIFLVLHPADALALSITSRTLASFANQRGGQLWKSYVIAQSLPCYADEDDSDPNHRRDVEGAVETMCHRCRDLGDIEDKYIHSDYYFCVRCVDWLGYKNAKGGNIRSPIKARAYIMNYKLRKRGLHRMHWDEFPESSDWVASGEGKASDIADRVLHDHISNTHSIGDVLLAERESALGADDDEERVGLSERVARRRKLRAESEADAKIYYEKAECFMTPETEMCRCGRFFLRELIMENRSRL